MIEYWNRKKQKTESEQVYGEAGVQLLYGNPLSRYFTDRFLTRPWLSKAYGYYQSSRLSQPKISPFIREFRIPIEDFEGAPFANFNDFFIRKFKPGLRSFPSNPKVMGAFCEARYLAFESISEHQTFPVKGEFLKAEFLMGNRGDYLPFESGPMLIARLCPTDYHRFHFPDSGRVLRQVQIPGKLHSVNPSALKQFGQIFGTNERQVSILATENFGTLAYIEIGALCVGKIVQTHPTMSHSPNFLRGEEKGYFLFGASTVIVLGEKGRWRPSPDLLERTAGGIETLVELGEPVGSA